MWQEHLEKITLLREAVSWRGYGQQNPLTEYKKEAFQLFAQAQEITVLLTLFQLFRGLVI